MKISKSGWLYKFHRLFGSTVYLNLQQGYNVNLCEMFWSTVGLVCLATFLLVGALSGLFIAFSILWVFLVAPYTGWFINEIWAFVSLLLTISFTGVFGFLYGFKLILQSVKGEIPWLPTYISKYLPEKKYTSKVKNKPNLLMEYIKAKKNKWCPLVELEE